MDKLTWTRYGNDPGAPAVYLVTDASEGEKLFKQVKDLGWTLVVLSGADWNRDLSPWPARAVFRGQPDFGGGAKKMLRTLTEKILPEAEKDLNPKKRYLAGYSLAGLFAVWAAFETDCFDGVASVSGSMWYPGLTDYVQAHQSSIERAYFSMGDREKLSRNPAFRRIEESTEWVEGRLCAMGARTVFERNPGGHFENPIDRMEKAIRWLNT